MSNRKDTNSGHCFPAYPHMSAESKKTREAIRKAQEILEAKQRAEEDKLLEVCVRECLFCLFVEYMVFNRN